MMLRKRKGSILILVLWTMTFLSFFAVTIGLKIRQRITLLSRLEKRSQLHFIAKSGVKKAMAAIKMDILRGGQILTASGKMYRHNNPELFKDVVLGDGTFAVVYIEPADIKQKPEFLFGVQDEDSKVNINTADRYVMGRLFQVVLNGSEEETRMLVDAIIDWREPGQSQIVGFYSDDFYSSLQYPYEIKNSPFEHLDELRLVQGFSPEVFERVIPFLTIYGDGKININTAPKNVLIAIGLNDVVADKILGARQGIDGEEATEDDYIFQRTFDIATEILSFIELEIDEIKMINAVNEAERIKTNSLFFRIHSRGQLNVSGEDVNIHAVYNASDDRIEYWRQK